MNDFFLCKLLVIKAGRTYVPPEPDNAACSDSSSPFFVISSLFPVKGGCIVFSSELLEIALRVEISDNVTCVCKRPNLVSIMP